MKLAAAVAGTLMLIGLSPLASADELVWSRRSELGQTAIWVGTDGEMYCIGCDFDNRGHIPIKRDRGVTKEFIPDIEPWISTLWIVLFWVDLGNGCGKGDWYTLSLNTHTLRHVDTHLLGCDDVSVSVTDHGLGMRLTMRNKAGRTLTRTVE